MKQCLLVFSLKNKFETDALKIRLRKRAMIKAVYVQTEKWIALNVAAQANAYGSGFSNLLRRI